MVEEVVSIVGNWGFPIAVSIYLLVRIEGKLDHLAESISALSEAIRKS
ncbi:MAG: YvrJ family protein [Firmicutes bacterium]|nr:YvrJ family protein [Bacillota bacterium]